MKYEELIILLPCHSLEDFPTHQQGDEAEALLAAWTSLWHPALIAASGKTPTWYRIDIPPENVARRLIVAPAVGAVELPTGFAARVRDEGGVLIRRKTRRDEIIATALEGLTEPDPSDGASGETPDVSRLDPELAADFLALGYAYLQVQLLTRQMRYASNLDETYFRNQAIAGAVAAVGGDVEEARRKLTACFDLLAQERDHFYSVEVYLVDVTMVAAATAAALDGELSCESPINLMFPGALLDELAARRPETLNRIRERLAADNLALIGGGAVERSLPLLSSESVLAELRRGAALYEHHLGRPLRVFGRWRYGLTPSLPSILRKLDFEGGLHAGFEAGRVPDGSQVKTRWEGADGAGLDSLARTPLDAARAETFLSLAAKMGESMDTDHVATICFAHWPGRTSPYYDDLRRVTRYGAALGRFVTVDQYFRDTVYPGQTDRFTASQYKSPLLKQDVLRRRPDPLSRWVRYWGRQARYQMAEAAETLAALLLGDPSDPNEHRAIQKTIDDLAEPDAMSLAPPTGRMTGVPGAVENAVADAAPVDDELASRLQRAVDRLQTVFVKTTSDDDAAYLVFNPTTSVRRVPVDVDKLTHLPSVERPIYAAAESDGQRQAVVDVPPMGYVLVQGDRKSRPPRRPGPLLADVMLLRNEFVEVHFDESTGAIQSVKDYGARGNRMSHQLALYNARPRGRAAEAVHADDESAPYSVMAVDSLEVTAASTLLGEMTARGRLLDREGGVLAKYEQVTRIRRGSRVLQIDIELEPLAELASDPWQSYFCSRVAWADEAADVWRTVNNVRQPAGSGRFEAPQYIEAENGDQRVTIFTGGLPYHRRVGLRTVDTPLIVRGESARKFRIGVGLDVAYPMQEAMHFLSPAVVIPMRGAAPASVPSAWLMHIDARNVAATHWSPLIEEGKVVGFRCRLQETAGRMARTKISAFRKLTKARQVDFRGLPLGECPIKDGAVSIELAANEWSEIECWF